MSKRFKKAKKRQRSKTYLSILVILIGIFAFIYSFGQVRDHFSKEKYYIETEGSVVDYDCNSDGNCNIVVEYHAKRQTYTVKSKTATNHPKDIGSEVKVMYDPENPSDSMLKNESADILMMLIGILFAVIGVYATKYNQHIYKTQFLDVEKEHMEKYNKPL